MRHFLRTGDFRIAVTLACADSGLDLLGFIPEYFGEKHLSERVTKYIKDVVFDVANAQEEITHTPDGVLALSKAKRPALFFLEVDRGNAARTRIIVFFIGQSPEKLTHAAIFCRAVHH